MKTRRSWRNQNRLWQDLCNGPLVNGAASPAPKKPAPRYLTAEEIKAMPGLSKTSRNMMLRDVERRKLREALKRTK